MRVIIVKWSLVVVLMAGIAFSMLFGTMALDLNTVWAQGLSAQQSLVLWHIRLPRVVMAAMVGAGLAVAGVALQSLFRNPLAEPGLIGVSSSAALGAVLIIVLGAMWWGSVEAWHMSLMAFAFGIASIGFIYLIATRQGYTDVALMLLAGVALNALTGALIGVLVFIADDIQLRSLTFWMMGSFANLSWNTTYFVGAAMGVSLIGLWWLKRPMNAFLLGERTALHMGFNPRRFKWQVMLLSALLVSSSVSVVGVIGFVGLIVPHIIRLCCGADHRTLLPLSALAGASLLVYADLFARILISPGELPIGLLMALLGGPFFLMMLLAKRRGF
ncbi:FecCD family ABC transporter permease [Thiomicrorhabdus aquaedulcis]|uniref:FecCD family ABC transporter permease n=1 Tax=Thiomicrorhabdus aquaedulcis TaxID=2211106 RepID=UPI00156268C9|nr:iron ABC transporter permease [Thiomicrorhabdus aquaedulcis]